MSYWSSDVCSSDLHALDAAGELDHFAGLHVVEAVDAGHAVADRQHLADLGDIRLVAEVFDLVFQNGGNFRGADVHHPTPFMASCSLCSLLRRDEQLMRLPTSNTSPPPKPHTT